ncbi:sialin-like isoform X2 [Planococcus citri]|uniref:sialin-like isoform X2 n=1 Tax=Planococcus citri TaxID=170843 RepID=UPI0031FA3559
MNVSSRTEPLKIIQCSASPPKTMSDDCEDPYKLLNVSTESIPKAPSIWFSKRFVVAVLSFFGYMTYTFAQVISIAIVEMTTTKVEVIGNETITRPAEFNWNLQEVGLVLNMFWYGFFFSVIGGYLAQKFGGVTILGLSTMLTGIIVVLNPLSVRCNFYLFLLARGLIGLLQSFSSAGYTDVFARWVPRKERAAVMSIVLDGMYAGTAIMYPVCGFLAHKWGWSMTFYFTGTVCIGWSILWLLIVRNDPSQDHRISKKELEYILQGTENVAVKSDDSNPYKEILKSPSYWALSIGKFAFNWGSAFTVMYLPLYIKDMTHRNIKEIGLLAFAPNVSIFIIPAVGMSIDYWQNHSTLTTTRINYGKYGSQSLQPAIGTDFILANSWYYSHSDHHWVHN